jgi:hypothetical protein
MSPTDSRLPNWPPPADEPFGIDRAREYIAWVRAHAPPVLAEAEAMLAERYPGAETHRSAVKAEQLAEWCVWEGMKGLAIGSVWCKVMAGSHAMGDIVITADGRLIDLLALAHAFPTLCLSTARIWQMSRHWGSDSRQLLGYR